MPKIDILHVNLSEISQSKAMASMAATHPNLSIYEKAERVIIDGIIMHARTKCASEEEIMETIKQYRSSRAVKP